MADPVTTADVLIPLSAAFFGALAGGGATLYANRREVTRTRRVALFDELLPAVRERLQAAKEALEPPDPRVHPGVAKAQIGPVLRSARIAGGRDRSRADGIADLANTYRALLDEYEERGMLQPILNKRTGELENSPAALAQLERMRTTNNQLMRKVDEFSDWLDRRF